MINVGWIWCNQLRWATGINISANTTGANHNRLVAYWTAEGDESADRLRKFGWKIPKTYNCLKSSHALSPEFVGIYWDDRQQALGVVFFCRAQLGHRVIVSVSFGPSDPRWARALAKKFAQQLPGSCRGPVCGSQLVPICSVAIRSLWLALFIDVKWRKSLRRSKNLGTSWYILVHLGISWYIFVPMEKSRNY